MRPYVIVIATDNFHMIATIVEMLELKSVSTDNVRLWSTDT